MLTQSLVLGFCAAASLAVSSEALASARCHMVASITAQQEVPRALA